MLRRLCAALVVALFVLPAHANANKEDAIRDLLEVVMDSSFKQIVQAVQKQQGRMLKQSKTEFSDRQINAAMKSAERVLLQNKDEFYDQLVPIYDRHFSAGEIDQLRGFYESDVGQKLARKQGRIFQEAMKEGREWMKRMKPKIKQYIREDLK